MPAPFELRHAGARYALVARRDVHQPLDERAARHLIDRGLREHGQRFARELEALAQQLGASMTADPARAVINALVAGRLVAVQWDVPASLMSEPEYIELRDIGGGDVAGPLVGGDPREPTPALRTTWLSFDVVDGSGEPLASGRFGAAIDGRGDGGPLDAQVHHYDMLRPSAAATLQLRDIVWPFEPRARDEPTVPSVPATAGPHWVSLEVVDDQGVALSGRYTLTESPAEPHADVLQGDLGGVLRHEVAGTSPQLQLHDIVLPFVPPPSPPAR